MEHERNNHHQHHQHHLFLAMANSLDSPRSKQARTQAKGLRLTASGCHACHYPHPHTPCQNNRAKERSLVGGELCEPRGLEDTLLREVLTHFVHHLHGL